MLACGTAYARELKYENDQTKDYVVKIANDVRSKKLIEISAGKIGREYRSNEVTADTQYKNKFLFIEGTIDSVSKDAFGTIVVNLRSDNQFMPVMARFDKKVAVITGIENTGDKLVTRQILTAADAAATIKRGSKVHMVCGGDGFLMGSPQLSVCDLISR